MDSSDGKSLNDLEFLDIKGLDGQERDRLISLWNVKGFRFYDSSESVEAPSACEPQLCGHEESGPGTKLNKTKVFEPCGIQLLRKAEQQGQAASQRPKDNQWVSSSKSPATLFHQSATKWSALTPNCHQVPCNVGVAVHHATPAKADDRLSLQQEVRSAVPGQLHQSGTKWPGLTPNRHQVPCNVGVAVHHATPAKAADRLSLQQEVRSAVRGVLNDRSRSVLPPRPKGIQNVAMSCYFNLLIQSILVIEGFASFLDGVLEALNGLPFDGVAVLQDIAPVCASLIRLWMDYNEDPCHVGTVREEHAVRIIRSLNNKEFALDRQSDPMELYTLLVSKIQVELDGMKQDRSLHPEMLLPEQAHIDKECPLQRSFKGLMGDLRHIDGRPTVDGVEPFYFLALPINTQEVTSVKGALEKYFDYTVCEQTMRLEKHYFFELPETLVLSFENTIVDHNGQMKKIDKQIDLNQELVLSDDMLSDRLKTQLKKERKVVTYQLISGFYHRGQCIDGGHYVAFQGNKCFGWCLLDDGDVHAYPTAEQLFHAQKVEKTQVPHGLLYKLVSPLKQC